MDPLAVLVLDEKRDLDERIDRLIEFMKSPECHSLTFAEQDRLTRQQAAMAGYSAILGERIEAFAK